MSLILPLGILAAVAVIFGSKSASASETEPEVPRPVPPPDPKVPTGPAVGSPNLPSAETPETIQAAQEAIEAVRNSNWESAVVAAILSRDAQTVDRIADQMSAAGLLSQAETVRGVARAWREEAARQENERRAREAEETNQPVVPVTPEDIRAAEPPPPPDPPVNPQRVAAEELSAYVLSTTRSKADQAKIKALQIAMGEVNADGLYGNVSARRIASFGLIPPSPFYWPASNAANVLAQYQQFLQDRAKADPARADLWMAASRNAGVVRW
ncbi:MAG: hypothetical protein KIT41_14255 [Pyrinomonadaceae bacterium]|nr:hypothetical protein [Pyrinomonadaceae bacterium]